MRTATAFISRFQVKHVFLSIGALDIVHGPMNAAPAEADLSATALRCGTHRVILADSSKFGAQAFVRVCGFDDIEVIVTEKPPPAEFEYPRFAFL